MLTGTMPYPMRAEANFLPDFSRTPTTPEQFNAEVPDELSQICLAACAATAAERPVSARELATELEGILGGVVLDFRLKYPEE